MFCERCGAAGSDNAKFCEKCGAAVGGGQSLPVARQAPFPPQQYAQPSAQQYAPPPHQQYAAPAPQQHAPPPQAVGATSQVVLVQPSAAPQSSYPPGYNPAIREPLTTGAFLVMFLLQAIPLVGFILLLVWAFGSDVNINKKSFARAILVMSVIVFCLWLVVVFGAMLVGAIASSR